LQSGNLKSKKKKKNKPGMRKYRYKALLVKARQNVHSTMRKTDLNNREREEYSECTTRKPLAERPGDTSYKLGRVKIFPGLKAA